MNVIQKTIDNIVKEMGVKALNMSFKDLKTEFSKVLNCSKDALSVNKDDIMKYLAGKRKEIEQQEADLDHNIYTDHRMKWDATFSSMKEDIELGLSNGKLIDALKNGIDNQSKEKGTNMLSLEQTN